MDGTYVHHCLLHYNFGTGFGNLPVDTVLEFHQFSAKIAGLWRSFTEMARTGTIKQFSLAFLVEEDLLSKKNTLLFASSQILIQRRSS